MNAKSDLRVLPRATEAECQQAIVEAATAAGWLVHAERPARTALGWRTAVQGHRGFPDLVLVHARARRLVIVELKRRPNQVEPGQARWLAGLRDAGSVDVRVWWVPEQLPQILAFLTDPGRNPLP